MFRQNRSLTRLTINKIKEGEQQSIRKIKKYSPKYVPSSIEKYIIENSVKLGYNDSINNISGCDVWNNSIISDQPGFHDNLLSYAADLDRHTEAIKNFSAIPDLMPDIIRNGNHKVCTTTRLHPDGLKGLFPSHQLSRIYGNEYLEPLLPPMRNHKICEDKKKFLMNMDYLVHDFEAMCYKLLPHSKKVLIDIGASLEYHVELQPVVHLLKLYEKFGFYFDHIYAFEVKKYEPEEVFEKLLPLEYMAAYHWINTGVNATEGHKMNPLHSILKHFTEDDFIVVKLDIDVHSVELPLAEQILEGGENKIYHRLIDQFYFEHHVHLKELAPNWKLRRMVGSIKDSLDLFYGLREKGIPAHFWP